MTLVDYLKTENMKASRLAERLNVSVSTITRILNGQREPGLDLMRKISRVTDGRVTPNDFAGEPPAPVANAAE